MCDGIAKWQQYGVVVRSSLSVERLLASQFHTLQDTMDIDDSSDVGSSKLVALPTCHF